MRSVQYSVSPEHEQLFDEFASKLFPRNSRGNKKKTIEALIIYASENIDAKKLRDFYYKKIGDQHEAQK